MWCEANRRSFICQLRQHRDTGRQRAPTIGCALRYLKRSLASLRAAAVSVDNLNGFRLKNILLAHRITLDSCMDIVYKLSV